MIETNRVYEQQEDREGGLAKLVEKHGPLPLGEEVTREAARRNGENNNIHTIATELTVRSVDESELPPAVRAARKEVDKIEAKKAEADRKLNEQIQAWGNYQRLLTEIGQERQHLNTLNYFLKSATDCINDFATDFANIAEQLTRDPRAPTQLWSACTNLAGSKEVAERLPRILAEQESKIGKLQAEAGSLRDKYDFA